MRYGLELDIIYYSYYCGLFLFILDLYSTHAYQAPPTRVIEIPRAFVVVMVRLKRETENKMVKTCLTFAEKKKKAFTVS